MPPHSLIIVTEHFEPEIGATSQLLTDLAGRLIDDGRNVTVLTSAQSLTSSSYVVRLSNNKSIPTSGILSKASKGLRFVLSAILWFLRHPPDSSTRILVVSNPPFVGAVALFARLFYNQPYVFLFQDVFPRSAVLSGILPARGPLTYTWILFIKLVIAYSAKTIVLSESMYHRVASDFGSKEKLTIIPNWSVLKPSLPTPPIPEQHPNLSRIPLQVQYSGNFGRLHDILTILEASRILLANGSDIHFTFIGAGAKVDQILTYKQSLHLANITIKPYQPKETAFSSISSCDVSIISIIPGAQDTIAPCKLYGILAAGKPVILIARSECYIAKLISMFDIGCLVEPGEPQQLASVLEYLAANPTVLARMAENAKRLYYSQYVFDIAYDKYLSIL